MAGKKSDKNKVTGPTKSMDRKSFNRKPKQVKTIPRSNKAAVIVPLPRATIRAGANKNRNSDKMFRRDI